MLRNREDMILIDILYWIIYSLCPILRDWSLLFRFKVVSGHPPRDMASSMAGEMVGGVFLRVPNFVLKQWHSEFLHVPSAFGAFNCV